MNASLIPLLRCPVDYSADLRLEVNANREERIESGRILCPDCGAVYAVEQGIARMLPPELVRDSRGAAVQRPDVDSKRQEMRARDEQAEEYDRMWHLNLFTLVEAPAMLMNLSLNRSHTLLEAGCGTGRMTAQFAEKAGRVVAVDFSWRSLLACREKLESAKLQSVSLIQADICRLPIRSEVFDRVVSGQVLEHIPTPETRELAVEELARVLKADGNMALSAYQYSMWMRLFGEKEGKHRGGIYFYRFTRDELCRLLSRHFTVERISGALLYHYIARCRKGSS